MNTHRILVLTIVVLLAGTLWLGRVTAQPAAVAPAQTRVAVVDVAQVFNNSQQAKDLTSELEQRRQALQVEAQQRQRELEALRMDLDALAPGSDAYQAKLDQIEQAGVSAQVWQRVEEAKLQRTHNRLTEAMYNRILEAIGQVAQEQGFQLVLYRDNLDMPTDTQRELMSKIALRKVLYHDPGLDITDAVLARVNQQYNLQGR